LYRQLQCTPSAGAVGAKLLNPDGTLQTSCVQSVPTILNQAFDAELFRGWFPNSRLWGMEALWAGDADSAEVEVLSGACIMARRNVFQTVGMFSQDYFMFCEDTDLCYKIRQSGYKNYYIPTAKIIHYGGSSTQQSHSQFSNVMMRESICRFFTKTRGPWYCIGYRVSVTASAMCRLLLLALAFPWRWIRGGVKSARQSFTKWVAILRWSLGAHTWLHQYK
jgi:N-acetylglucosaminyl-diphospho-decaprenol L-rhamnosyltransferase